MKKLVVITGPTAVGKTELSLAVAREFHGEIINCDASQFRKQLNIGTAKLDLSQVDVPHHLIDFLNPTDPFSIKDFQEVARKQISILFDRGILPILVGGSGLYINAAIGDYDLSDEARDPDFEKQYREESDEALWLQLQELDPSAAKSIPAHNRRRILRAIYLAKTGRKISENKAGTHLLYDALIICLITDRDVLYDRINHRVDAMFAAGWIEEVKSLVKQGIDMNAIRDIGYREVGMYLDGLLSLEEAKEIIRQKTRNYAKRQMTWFRNKMKCTMISMDSLNPRVTYQKVQDTIGAFLKI